MLQHSLALLVLGLLLLTPALVSADKAVKEDLAKLKGENGNVQVLSDDVLVRTFPRYLFFSVTYRQYPVAVLTPEGLKFVLSVFSPREAFVVEPPRVTLDPREP